MAVQKSLMQCDNNMTKPNVSKHRDTSVKFIQTVNFKPATVNKTTKPDSSMFCLNVLR